MVRGIGIDMVEIGRIEAMMKKDPLPAFFRYVFTEEENRQAPDPSHPKLWAAYYAARFAAKEAVFKAVAQLTPEKTFDLRIVETLHRPDGSPYIHVTEDLAPVLEKAGVKTLHLSVTTEGGFAAAFVVATD